MKSVNDLLKINALCLLCVGTLLAVIPDNINTFLNQSNNIPKLMLLSVGIGMNLSGFLLLNIAKKSEISQWHRKTAVVIDTLIMFLLIVSLIIQNWVTTVNGMTITGLLTIGFGWFGYCLLSANHNS